MVSTGYAIADLSALRAISSDKRADGYARLVVNGNNGNSAWYVFQFSNTFDDDGDQIIIPDDNPSSGRFVKIGGGAVTDDGSGDEYVTLNTEQNIVGSKKFLNEVKATNFFSVTETPNYPHPAFCIYDEGNVSYDYDGNPYSVFSINTSGHLNWAEAGFNPDVHLYRQSSETLTVIGTFRVDGKLYVASDVEIVGQIQGNINLQEGNSIQINQGEFRQKKQGTHPYASYSIDLNGDVRWGPGTSDEDTFLYRKAPNQLETGKLVISNLKISSLETPPSSSSSGTPGEIRFAGDAIYLCVAQNTWKRALLSNF